ncbi:hypothetical protein BT96DRAFT_935947 [Gymnopus androsaceus JB14]|uniref:Uncharacterized protein n=1 Tax=Gymnopus androsaceus JB14 TaxID=1447944 RepID=A0A6A4I563_9AGAR|nr:hypothetical protein BT96DRAFT_935947 [Gymnopus androsaceus JB14]
MKNAATQQAAAPSLLLQTWTQTTYFPQDQNISAGFSFSGIAIYVYLIVTNESLSSSLVSNVYCDFRLDGEIMGSFSHLTDNSSNTQFDVLAFSKTDGKPHDAH